MTILDTQNMTPDTADAIKKALAGEEILISEDGKLYAKITKVVKVDDQYKPRKKRNLVGSMPDLVIYMADDFNEPLDDFKEYMPD